MANHQINLNLKEIYQQLCPECQQKLLNLIKDKLADQAIKDALEGKNERE